MNIQERVKISLLIGAIVFTSGTVCSAKQTTKVISKQAQPTTPELAQADERVRLSKIQLETARKQVDAARALFRAAQADFRAAQADRQALALMTKAQSLADASGLQPPTAVNQAVTNDQSNNQTGKTSKPTNLESFSGTRSQQLDFNAAGTQSEQLPLR